MTAPQNDGQDQHGQDQHDTHDQHEDQEDEMGKWKKIDELSAIRKDFETAKRNGASGAQIERGAQRLWDARQKAVVDLLNAGVPEAEIRERLNRTDPGRGYPL